MSDATTVDSYQFPLSEESVEVLQELQVILVKEDNQTYGQALESTIAWYGRVIQNTDILRFIPPESQPGWRPYRRSLKLNPGESLPAGDGRRDVRVEAAAAMRLLAESEELLQLAKTTSLEEIIRLRAEYQFRLADSWKVELGP